MTSHQHARTMAVAVVAVIALVGLAGCDGDDDPAAAESSEPAAVDPSEPEASEPKGDDPPAEPSEPPTSSQPADDDDATVESAAERFEQFMHAYGRGDADTVCEIGREAILAGVGYQVPNCARAVALGRRFNGAQILASLRSATVDPTKIDQVAPDRVEIPRSAISEGATIFTAAGDRVVMIWDGDDWTVNPH